MNYQSYINETVNILQNGNINIYGQLIDIIPAEEAEDCVDTLVILSGSKRKIQVPINEIYQFFPEKDFRSPDTEYYYVIFRYGKTDRSKKHIYMSYDYSIKPGDKVLVWNDWLYVGNVIETGFYKKDNAPYPVEKTWLIEKKVYDRIDFMKYDNSATVIDASNLYKDKYLNSDNDYKQYLATPEWPYHFLSEEFDKQLVKLDLSHCDKDQVAGNIVANTEYFIDWEWCESNQLDVFYRTLCICKYIARYNGYDKFQFDKYLCLSLIYKHGDFDRFICIPDKEKEMIENDINLINLYISSLNS